MKTLMGKGVFGGVAIGTLRFHTHKSRRVKRLHVEDTAAELSRLAAGISGCASELEVLYEKALREVGSANAEIFRVHRMMLEDADFREAIEHTIVSRRVNAEYAAALAADRFSKMFSEMEDVYMRARSADVRDVSERLISRLTGGEENITAQDGAVIIAADDLLPSETVQLDKSRVLAFATRKGSQNSHTAILARTMNIPAIVGIGEELLEEYDGCTAAVDGAKGVLYLQPDEDTLCALSARMEEERARGELLRSLRGLDNITRDGVRVDVFANIGDPSDLGAVLENDAGGVGLLRSEFLYLGREEYPSEETQFAAYRRVLESLAGKKAVIRTLDIGADKQADYFDLPQEENPAMGLRGSRVCLERRGIFITQLRALMRASVFGRLAIMFPMITSVWEIEEIKHLLCQVKEELRGQGIPYSEEVELGIMVETPAAALISRELAEHVDFFSIGTNDLSQYTLAVDRQNQQLERFFDPLHPAILRLIQNTVSCAKQAGIWVGICGELAADSRLTEWFLQIGVDELSVSPPYVLPLRRHIRELSVKTQPADTGIEGAGNKE